MKSFYTTTLFLPVFFTFFSCEKTANVDDTPIVTEDTTRYDISFKVSAFTKQDIPLGSLMSSRQNVYSANLPDSNAVFSYLKVLDYFLYNEQGQLVTSRNQVNGSQVEEYVYYGEVAFALPKGKYKMVVIGSMGGLTFTDSTRYSTAYMSLGDTVEDIFYKEVNFNVDGINNIKETITIERIVGSLEVKQREMVDQLWAGKPEIRVRSVIKYPFDKNNPYFYPEEKLLLPQISGEPVRWQTIDFVSRGFILPDRSGSFDPQAYLFIRGTRMNIIAEGNLENVVIKPNTKTILTGSITGDSGQQYFDVNADSTWNNVEYGDLELGFGFMK